MRCTPLGNTCIRNRRMNSYVQRHGLVAARSFDPVVLPLEGDAGLVGCDQPTIGDGDAVGVAREISEHGLRPAEWFLGIDHPLGLAQWREEGGECRSVGEWGVLAEEGATACCMRQRDHLEEEPS